MALINTLLFSPVTAGATLIVDGINFGSAGLNALRGKLRGEAYVFMFADALAGGQDFQSNTNPVTATATASSSSWFGTAAAFGLAIGPPLPPILIPTSGTTGIASANSIAGVGTTWLPATPIRNRILGHLGVMALDPRPTQPPARALLRAYFQLPDGRQKEFWAAAVSVAYNPTANRFDLSITDPLELLRPNAFRRYRLPDGSGGFMLRDSAGIDLVVPVPDDPEARSPGTQLRFETSTGADSTAVSTDKSKVLKTELTRLLGGATGWPLTVTSVLREAVKVAEADPTAAFRAVAIALNAADTENDDASRGSLVEMLGRVAGPRLVIDNVSRGVYLSDATFSTLRRVHFTTVGIGKRPRLSLTVNGKRPKSVLVSIGPGDGGVCSGELSWTFEQRRAGAAIWATDPAGLGLQKGANHVVLTARAADSRRIASAELFIYWPDGDGNRSKKPRQ